MDHVIRALIERLVEKGVELTSIPSFIRVLARAVSTDPFMSLPHLNWRMRQSGYDNIELDEYTLRLLMVVLTDSLNNSQPGETLWFEYGFNTNKVIRIDSVRRH